MSAFTLGYKSTLIEKHARLKIRKWNLEARMDNDTMLNKKAARGRRYSWACQQCMADALAAKASAADSSGSVNANQSGDTTLVANEESHQQHTPQQQPRIQQIGILSSLDTDRPSPHIRMVPPTLATISTTAKLSGGYLGLMSPKASSKSINGVTSPTSPSKW
eukprot:5317-Heterococcus_DN1.PRE.2